MKFVKMICTNCSATLDFDLDKLQTECPYCGQKLTMEFNGFDEVLKEREKTKRTKMETEERLKEKEMDQQSKEREEKRQSKHFIVMFSVFILLLIALAAGDHISSALNGVSHKRKNEVQVTKSAEVLTDNTNYNDTVLMLKSMGFTNVQAIGNEKLKIAVLHKQGEVEKVSINGDDKFLEGEWFPSDAYVKVLYYSKKGEK